MVVVVRGRHISSSAALHVYSERRVVFAIGRFRDRVRRVSVLLTGTASDRDAVVCRMAARVEGGERVLAEHRGERDPYRAVDAATRTLAAQLASRLARESGPSTDGPPPASA